MATTNVRQSSWEHTAASVQLAHTLGSWCFFGLFLIDLVRAAHLSVFTVSSRL